MAWLSVRSHIWERTVACLKILRHLAQLMRVCFCVWCVKCAKYLAFGTFERADENALDSLSLSLSLSLSHFFASFLLIISDYSPLSHLSGLGKFFSVAMATVKQWQTEGGGGDLNLACF